MKPIISITDDQIHIDDEHYTLFIRFKQQPSIKPQTPPRALPDTITVIREGDVTNSLHKKHISDKIKQCAKCGKPFKPTSNAQKYCQEHFTSRKLMQKTDLDTVLKEIEEKRKQPYKLTPSVV